MTEISDMIATVAGAICRSYRDHAIRRNQWKNAPTDDPNEVILAKTRQADPACYEQIMEESAVILHELEEAGYLKEVEA